LVYFSQTILTMYVNRSLITNQNTCTRK